MQLAFQSHLLQVLVWLLCWEKKAGSLFHRLPGYWKAHGGSIKESCNYRIFLVLAVWEMVL